METNKQGVSGCRPVIENNQSVRIMKHLHQLKPFNLYCIIDLEPIEERCLFWGGAALQRGCWCGNKSAPEMQNVVWRRTFASASQPHNLPAKEGKYYLDNIILDYTDFLKTCTGARMLSCTSTSVLVWSSSNVGFNKGEAGWHVYQDRA